MAVEADADAGEGRRAAAQDESEGRHGLRAGETVVDHAYQATEADCEARACVVHCWRDCGDCGGDQCGGSWDVLFEAWAAGYWAVGWEGDGSDGECTDTRIYVTRLD